MQKNHSRSHRGWWPWRLAFGLCTVGISLAFTGGYLPEGGVLLVLLCTFLLPLTWRRGFGSFAGVLILLSLLWLPVIVIDPGAPEVVAVLVFTGMLIALIASPLSIGLLCWQARISPYVMLASAALFPPIFTFLLNRYGDSLILAEESASGLDQVAWLASLWMPMWGLILGGLIFFIALMVLLLQEAQGVSRPVIRPPEATR
jgi:hypothetical protein